MTVGQIFKSLALAILLALVVGFAIYVGFGTITVP
jgi:hypothetical protein